MKFLCLFLCSVLLFSCARLDTKPASAARNRWSGDLRWKHQIYKSNFFGLYDKELPIFSDDPQARKKFIRSQKYQKTSAIFLYSGLIGALAYLAGKVGDFGSDEQRIYYGIFFAGWLPGVYFEAKSNSILNEAISEYNNKMGYVLAPVVMPSNNIGASFNKVWQF